MSQSRAPKEAHVAATHRPVCFESSGQDKILSPLLGQQKQNQGAAFKASCWRQQNQNQNQNQKRPAHLESERLFPLEPKVGRKVDFGPKQNGPASIKRRLIDANQSSERAHNSNSNPKPKNQEPKAEPEPKAARRGNLRAPLAPYNELGRAGSNCDRYKQAESDQNSTLSTWLNSSDRESPSRANTAR